MPDDPLEDDPEVLRAELDALKAEKAGLALDNAMLTAGVDLSTPTGKMFRRAYDGDPDPAKIKTEAEQIIGVLKADPAAAEADATESDPVEREDGEERQLAERTALTTGEAGGQADPDPSDEIFGNLGKEIDAGARAEDAGGRALQALTEKANAGDLRVLARPNGG